MRQATASIGAVALWALAGCASRGAPETTSSPVPSSIAKPAEDAAVTDATTADASVHDATPKPDATAPSEIRPLEHDAIDGPHEELSLEPGRSIYYALAKEGPAERRLIGHLHGVCGGPSYACGKWVGAGSAAGIMVCPTGNARCGDPALGPPSWEAPTWAELVGIMDKDLETAVAKVTKKKPVLSREGAILTGYSRGAFAAPAIARSHPNRWRHLVLIEANVPIGVTGLRAAGVKSVALVAGEQGNEIAGMRKTEATLEGAGYPVKLFVMRKTGHPYSTDMEDVMSAALSFVLAHDDAN